MIDSGSGLPVIPHEWVGGIDCCGCLVVEERGKLADLVCNECNQVVKTVAAAEVPMALSQMLLSQQENCHAHCPHCGALNVFPGFSPMLAFICSACGKGVTMSSAGQ
jgi:hypothetical protein